MATSYLRRLPAGFWLGLLIGSALAVGLEWYFGQGPGAANVDGGTVHGLVAFLAGFPLTWLLLPLAEAVPSAAVPRVSLVVLFAINTAAWGAALHLTWRSVARRVRALHAPSR